jgi:NAD kinase
MIALGGDGTILRALELATEHHAHVLGVNFGHLGFLADVDREDLASALDRIARGEAQIDERTARGQLADAGSANSDRVQRPRHLTAPRLRERPTVGR